jgi:hypothetical protein
MELEQRQRKWSSLPLTLNDQKSVSIVSSGNTEAQDVGDAVDAVGIGGNS